MADAKTQADQPQTDQQLADDIRDAIGRVAKLMNTARERNISVNFNIGETEMPNKKKVFTELVTIQKIEPL